MSKHIIEFHFRMQSGGAYWLVLTCAHCPANVMLRWFKASGDFDIHSKNEHPGNVEFFLKRERYLPTENQMRWAVSQGGAWMQEDCDPLLHIG